MLSTGTVKENLALKTQHNFNFDILEAGDAQFRDYQISGTPYFVLIDSAGKIQLTETASNAKGIAEIVDSVR